jgi:hypothetical protein
VGTWNGFLGYYAWKHWYVRLLTNSMIMLANLSMDLGDASQSISLTI